MQIDETFQDWQILDLTAYTMHILDLSQQGTLLAIEGYEIDPTNEIDITGFSDTQFQDLIDIQDLCTIVPEYSATPFNTSIYQGSNNVNSMQRDFILRFNVDLSICQYNFIDETIEREQYAFGDLNFDIDFENIINSDQSEVVQNIDILTHGKWLALSDSMGYQDSLGYWFIESYSASASYTNSTVESKVETTNFRAYFILRDGFINFDHRYFITQPDDQIILNYLGAKNPHAGKIEISTNSGKILSIEFSEDSVDIYIDDELRLDNVSWTDIRSRKLDMTFDYAND